MNLITLPSIDNKIKKISLEKSIKQQICLFLNYGKLTNYLIINKCGIISSLMIYHWLPIDSNLEPRKTFLLPSSCEET